MLLIIKIHEGGKWKTKLRVKRNQNNPAQLKEAQYDTLLALGAFQFS